MNDVINLHKKACADLLSLGQQAICVIEAIRNQTFTPETIVLGGEFTKTFYDYCANVNLLVHSYKMDNSSDPTSALLGYHAEFVIHFSSIVSFVPVLLSTTVPNHDFSEDSFNASCDWIVDAMNQVQEKSLD